MLHNLLPVAYAQETTVSGLVKNITDALLKPVISLLFVVATLVFFWGIIQYVIGSQGDTEKLRLGKQIMIWGVLGMTVMASAWGIVRVLCDFFGTCQQLPL